MNDARRKAISAAMTLIEQAKDMLATCCEEEQEYYDNMPESIQSGDKGSSADAAISSLTDAGDSLESAYNNAADARDG